MDRVREFVSLPSATLLRQELPQFIGVFGSEKVPDSAPRLSIGTRRGVEHDVDGVGDIHV